MRSLLLGIFLCPRNSKLRTMLFKRPTHDSLYAQQFALAHSTSQSQVHASLASNLLQLPFLRELLIQLLQILNNIGASLNNGIFGAQLAISLNAQLDVGEEGVRGLVGSEEDVGGLVEVVAEEIAESVVLLVQGEESSIWHTCRHS